ncbi:MAG TPA: fasciclin domain-containing protein [Burkholderiaceae bacterium]|nr:fasciclin domain-containing protein [Burkholderiaceae bacterium]
MNRRTWLLGLLAVSLAGCASMQPKNVADVIASDSELSTLNKLINDAGLTQTLSGTGPFTVFAPSNAAFKAVPAKTMGELATNKALLTQVLTFHVVPAKAMSADVKQGNLKSVNGANLGLAKAGNYVTVESAIVTRPDLAASNGVVHVVDSVLLPPTR